jgi:hypothetical protein
LVDQLFDSREMRSARVLSSASYGNKVVQGPITVNLIQEALTVNLKSLAALAAERVFDGPWSA